MKIDTIMQTIIIAVPLMLCACVGSYTLTTKILRWYAQRKGKATDPLEETNLADSNLHNALFNLEYDLAALKIFYGTRLKRINDAKNGDDCLDLSYDAVCDNIIRGEKALENLTDALAEFSCYADDLESPTTPNPLYTNINDKHTEIEDLFSTINDAVRAANTGLKG